MGLALLDRMRIVGETGIFGCFSASFDDALVLVRVFFDQFLPN